MERGGGGGVYNDAERLGEAGWFVMNECRDSRESGTGVRVTSAGWRRGKERDFVITCFQAMHHINTAIHCGGGRQCFYYLAGLLVAGGQTTTAFTTKCSFGQTLRTPDGQCK